MIWNSREKKPRNVFSTIGNIISLLSITMLVIKAGVHGLLDAKKAAIALFAAVVLIAIPSKPFKWLLTILTAVLFVLAYSRTWAEFERILVLFLQLFILIVGLYFFFKYVFRGIFGK